MQVLLSTSSLSRLRDKFGEDDFLMVFCLFFFYANYKATRLHALKRHEQAVHEGVKYDWDKSYFLVLLVENPKYSIGKTVRNIFTLPDLHL